MTNVYHHWGVKHIQKQYTIIRTLYDEGNTSTIYEDCDYDMMKEYESALSHFALPFEMETLHPC